MMFIVTVGVTIEVKSGGECIHLLDDGLWRFFRVFVWGKSVLEEAVDSM